MRIYIDTSVINGFYAQDIRIVTATNKFLGFVRKNGSVLYTAELTVEEINHTPDELKRKKLKEALAEFEVEFLPYGDDVKKLANIYISQKIIPVKYMPDAVHIATASIHNVPALVSWNFEHIVKLKTKVEINRINRKDGYPEINISSPEEV